MADTGPEPFLVAAVQAAPVFLDRAATVEKACALIAEAGAVGARLAVFPEGFIPAYPLWAWFIPPGETHALRELYSELVENAVSVPSPATARLCEAAREAGVAVAMGINEINSEASGATLYNSLLYIGPDGRLVGYRLTPRRGFTSPEEQVWFSGATLAPDLSLPKIRLRIADSSPGDDTTTPGADTGRTNWSPPAQGRRTATGIAERAAIILDSDDDDAALIDDLETPDGLRSLYQRPT